MSKSSIEWTTDTWNPIVGCSVLSPGCIKCYAMKEAYRFGFNPKLERYHGLTKLVNGKAVWTGIMREAPETTLLAPLKRKKPTTYFVNSMGDLFHEDVPDEWIDKVFAVMALCPQHTFQVLTKRAARMRDYVLSTCRELGRQSELRTRVRDLTPWPMDHLGDDLKTLTAIRKVSGSINRGWQPLPNVWLGVSTERQQEADERIPLLLQTPAAIRFISAEPLLGPIDLTALRLSGITSPFDALQHGTTYTGHDAGQRFYHSSGHPVLDWVIVGGESGPDARPMHPDWARRLRDQCKAAGVPFFFKQWGNWHPEIDRDRDDPDWRQPYTDYKEPHFQILNLAGGRGFHGDRVHIMRSCSKKSGGRALDGIEYSEMPEAR